MLRFSPLCLDRLKIAILSSALIFTATLPAARADWNFGCIGRLETGDSIHFDRSSLVLVSEKREPGENGVRTFKAKNPDAGLGGPLAFRHAPSGDTILLRRLTASSPSRMTTLLSCRLPKSGIGRRTMKRSRVDAIYQVVAPGLTLDIPSVESLTPEEPSGPALECYDETISNCR